MNEALQEYFSNVLGVETVQLPPPEVSTEVVTPEPVSLPAESLVTEKFQVVEKREGPSERLVFVEMAGEDQSFFHGPCGEMLEKMIVAMKLTPDQVSLYRCRGAIDSVKQFETNAPIVFMGSGSQSFLGHTVYQIRGQWLGRCIVTFHPSWLLERTELKAKTWADLKRVLREMV